MRYCIYYAPQSRCSVLFIALHPAYSPFDCCTNFSSLSNFIEKDFLGSVEQFFNKKNITKFRKLYCFTIIVTNLNDRNRASYVDMKQFPFELQKISNRILLTGYCTLKLFYTYILYKMGLNIKY